MILSYSLIGLLLFVLVDTHAFFRAYDKIPHLHDEIMRLYVNAVLMAGLLLWPLVWTWWPAPPPAAAACGGCARSPRCCWGSSGPSSDPGGHAVRARTQDACFESLHA